MFRSIASKLNLRALTVALGLAGIAAAALAPTPAKAWWVGPRVVIAPPVVVGPPVAYAPPPPVVYAPPPPYYVPHRYWVPGHWRGGYWVPGHWR